MAKAKNPLHQALQDESKPRQQTFLPDERTGELLNWLLGEMPVLTCFTEQSLLALTTGYLSSLVPRETVVRLLSGYTMDIRMIQIISVLLRTSILISPDLQRTFPNSLAVVDLMDECCERMEAALRDTCFQVGTLAF